MYGPRGSPHAPHSNARAPYRARMRSTIQWSRRLRGCRATIKMRSHLDCRCRRGSASNSVGAPGSRKSSSTTPARIGGAVGPEAWASSQGADRAQEITLVSEGIEAGHPRAHNTAERHDLEAPAPGALPAFGAAVQRTNRKPAHGLPRFAPAPVPSGEHALALDRAPSGDDLRSRCRIDGGDGGKAGARSRAQMRGPAPGRSSSSRPA